MCKFRDFCATQEVSFPCNKEPVVAAFLCHIADSSDRPKSQLASTQAAMVCLYDALGVHNTAQSTTISKLVTGLVKSATLRPMVQTPVMPVRPFLDLFTSWADNDKLSLKNLRLKAVCLLALVLMLRPSDVAPRGRVMDPNTLVVEQVIFGEDQVTFQEDGSLSLTLHGIKNDYSRDGFGVTLPPASAPKVDPGRCLKEYMRQTALIRHDITRRPVFVSLRRPYHALASTSISGVLNDAIKVAGLSDCGYTAKCFRPTATTRAIASGLKPEIARHIGRWRNAEVFEKHYVHTKVPDTYTDNVLMG